MFIIVDDRTGFVFKQTVLVLAILTSGFTWNFKSAVASLSLNPVVFPVGFTVMSYAVVTTL